MTSRVAPRNPDPRRLLREVDRLLEVVQADAAARRECWPTSIPGFDASAANLAAYLALRQQDLQGLQRDLMVLGLSSLGRVESRVIPSLQAVRATLAAMTGDRIQEWPPVKAFFDGEECISRRAAELLGPTAGSRSVAMLVTCPSTAADDPEFMRALAQRGVEAIRINCAHDDATVWQRMIDHARAVEAETGHRLRVLMDLGGPKIRTGKVGHVKGSRQVRRGDAIVIALPGKLKMARHGRTVAGVECSLPEAVQAARPGEHVLYDDGKVDAIVERVESWGILARVDRCADKGVKLKPEKGLNFPDTEFSVGALTEKDLEDLRFVATRADGIEFSFVQSPNDVIELQSALSGIRDDWQKLGLVLKIETAAAVARLPEILVQAASRQPTAIMIARGDLAVEIGFGRTAEMQEEILWLAEAAHTPAIWATQVLEQLVTKGTLARGEMTDAAMSAHAECVMLNKGPYVFEAIDVLNVLLQRMSAHQYKKTPKMRRLRSWAKVDPVA